MEIINYKQIIEFDNLKSNNDSNQDTIMLQQILIDIQHYSSTPIEKVFE